MQLLAVLFIELKIKQDILNFLIFVMFLKLTRDCARKDPGR